MISVLSLVVCLLFLLVGCQQTTSAPSTTTLFTGNAMATDYRIIVGGALLESEKLKVEALLQKTFHEINATFNRANPDSEISRLNRLKAGVKVPLSPILYRFFITISKIVELTEGRFDPTVGSLQALWQPYLAAGLVPPEVEICSLTDCVGWHKMHFEGGLFYKDADAVALDLAGVLKGYAVDLLTERLNACGYVDLFVEWGREVRTLGKHPKGRPWALLIRGLDDQASEHAIAYLHVHDRAIATSVDDVQNWTIMQDDGPVTYFHISDPHARRPLIATEDSIATASVMTDSCVLADGLATALMLFPTPELAAQWIEKIKLRVCSLTYWMMSRREWQENALKVEME